jgi:hypothetical protein
MYVVGMEREVKRTIDDEDIVGVDQARNLYRSLRLPNADERA